MSFKENIDDKEKYIQLSEEKFVYFIVEHGLFLKSTKTDIKGAISNLGSVVFKCNIKDKVFPMPKGFEGPFYSIEMLRTYSKIYKDLKVSNPKRANNIFNDNAIQLYRGYGKVKKGHWTS